MTNNTLPSIADVVSVDADDDRYAVVMWNADSGEGRTLATFRRFDQARAMADVIGETLASYGFSGR